MWRVAGDKKRKREIHWVIESMRRETRGAEREATRMSG
jgi:hypothetical protein